ncbi:methionyl-tRNA formyltransferase [Arenimonas sp.]|uniref:methionyl-tRNA formyltransferase n=1 Tax=Arenimonas sp. TaxID=1872635 RepID=UPI0037BE79E7
MSLRIVFAGTPEFAVPALRAGAARGEVVAVYTQPDRPAGRGRQLQMSPVKQAALELGLPVQQPLNFKSDEALDMLRSHAADLMVVVAYGLILPQAVLDTPRLGCWNVHASLLPRWRGAAPIQRAIASGDTVSGVCLMQMEKGLDTGPVLLQLKTPIGPKETGGSLHDRLSQLGAEVLRDGLALARAGMTLQAEAQPKDGVTYARKIEKSEAKLDWTLAAKSLADKVRAFNPWPVAETELQGERLRVYQAIGLDHNSGKPPGTVLAAGKDGIDVACGQGALRLLAVQRDGGRVQSAAEYLNARPLAL